MPTNFTHKNFQDDIPDAAADRDEDVEGHFGRSALDAEQVGVSLWRYGPNFRAPHGHRHEVQEEVYVVVGGSGQIRIDDEVIDLRRWDAVRVAPDATRGFRAGPDGLELISVGGNRPSEGDGHLVADWWTED